MDSHPPTPKRAQPTIALPTAPSLDDEDSNHSGNSTPTAPTHTPWTPTHLNEVFDRALPPVSLPHVTGEDMPGSEDVNDLHSTALLAADELNPEFCGFARFFLSSAINFLPHTDTDIPISSDALDKAIAIVSSVMDLGLGSCKGLDSAVVCPSDWLRLACHLIAAILHGALRSEALNTQLNFDLLMEDDWSLTGDLSLPPTERVALSTLVQQLSELVAPKGLGKSVIDYYERTCTNLTLEIDRIKVDTLQALHLELKTDPKIVATMWDSAIERLTLEYYDKAKSQQDDLCKVFLSALWAKIAGQPALGPHPNCTKLIASCTTAVYAAISQCVDSLITDSLQTQRHKLLQTAYDQARLNVEACYPSIVDEVMATTCTTVLQTEHTKVQALHAEAENLVQSEFDTWRHTTLCAKQDEAMAWLSQWEHDCQEEQLCDFACTWDSYPLHAIKPTLDAWLASHSLHVVPLDSMPPMVVDQQETSVSPGCCEPGVMPTLPDCLAPPTHHPILDLTPASTQYTDPDVDEAIATLPMDAATSIPVVLPGQEPALEEVQPIIVHDTYDEPDPILVDVATMAPSTSPLAKAPTWLSRS